jgi:enoyl-CoA hydratase/carnithine racemase
MSESQPEGEIHARREGPITVITIDRTAKLNAIGPSMLYDLERLLNEIDRDQECRVVIITGAGDRAFSVGADVNAWAAMRPLDMWRIWVREGHRILLRLASLRQPTIAALNGYVFGGGLELALATDIRIATESAVFAMPETKIGTLPGWAGLSRLPALIGMARSKQMIFSGTQIDAATAENWGLVNEVVTPATLKTRALELAVEIAANAPISVQLAKTAIGGDATALEAFAAAIAAGTDDGVEGVTAFREKRAPHFSGQ